MQSVKDTYQRITDTIIQQLEAGTKPWIRPWRGNVRRSATPLRASGEAYRGINVVMLWLSGQLAGYDENTWMTYRQAQELGAQVRKGEQGTLVVKYGTCRIEAGSSARFTFTARFFMKFLIGVVQRHVWAVT